jgi:hypothetical protein
MLVSGFSTHEPTSSVSDSDSELELEELESPGSGGGADALPVFKGETLRGPFMDVTMLL